MQKSVQQKSVSVNCCSYLMSVSNPETLIVRCIQLTDMFFCLIKPGHGMDALSAAARRERSECTVIHGTEAV